MEASRNDPSSRAGEAMALHFNHYPQGDWRAASSTDQQLAEMKAVTLDGVKDFYRGFYARRKVNWQSSAISIQRR